MCRAEKTVITESSYVWPSEFRSGLNRPLKIYLGPGRNARNDGGRHVIVEPGRKRLQDYKEFSVKT